MSHQKFISLPSEEKSAMLKRYYVELERRQSVGNMYVFILFGCLRVLIVWKKLSFGNFCRYFI